MSSNFLNWIRSKISGNKHSSPQNSQLINKGNLPQLSPKIFESWNRSEQPTIQIKKFAETRKLGILLSFQVLEDVQNEEHFLDEMSLATTLKRAFTPINPLLFATALSISNIRNEDFKLMIFKYSFGLDVPELEEALLRLEDFKDDNELEKILQLDDEYTKALIDLGQEAVVNDYLGTIIPGLDMNFPTMWNAYWGAWVAVNPIYQLNNMVDMAFELNSPEIASAIIGYHDANIMLGVWQYALDYSHKFNDAIHNAREYHEYNLNQANKEINKILQDNITADRKKELLAKATKKQKNITKLNQRAFRLYEWIPDEISAFAAETLSGLKDGNSTYFQYKLSDDIIRKRKQSYEESIKKK